MPNPSIEETSTSGLPIHGAIASALAVLRLLQGSSMPQATDPFIERTPSGRLRLPAAAAHVER